MGAGRGAQGLFASRASYVRYLATMHGVRSTLERALDCSGAARIYPCWPSRRIAGRLADDLRDLGVEPAPFARMDAQAVQALDEARMLGLLYVLEGSALGARLLARAADAAGYSAAFGARHLHAQTADPFAWRSLVAILDAADLDPAGEAACIRAATDAFGLFSQAHAAADGALP